MAFDQLLSAGALTQILENLNPANPVLQIIGYKPMTPDQMAFGTSTEELRYRLMIGDGIKAHQYCVITNQDLVEDIKSGRLEKWSIVRVTNYKTADYGEGPPEAKRRLIYILNLEVVRKGSEVGHKITCQEQNINQPPQHQQFIQNPPSHRVEADTTQPQPYPMNERRQDTIRSPQSIRNSYDQQTIGINELTPYIGRWVVKGRVTSKSQIREYNNAKGGGKVFSFTLADKTGEIKVTAFNIDCDRVYGYVEPNKVYQLGRAQVKNADKRYTTADFEITLNNDSLLEEVLDSKEANEIPLAKFNFVSIGSLSGNIPSMPVDLIGAILSVEDVGIVVSRTKNKELKKRNVKIVDMSRHSISVTIWGESAETFTGSVGDVFITKGARIGSFGGRSASAGDCIFINPDLPEARKIKNWLNGQPDLDAFTCLTEGQDTRATGDQWKTLEQMQDLEQAKINTSSGNASSLYAKCRATLMAVGKNPVYKCCPTEKCGKKLIDTQNGELKCEKCQQTFSSYKYRYKTDVEIADQSASCWVTLWDEKAELVLKMKPEDLERYMKMESKEAYDKVISQPLFKQFVFTFRARIDTYNQAERVKLAIINMAPVDHVSFSKRLIEEIKSMSASAA